MPYATARDGTQLYYEQTGRGTPIVFVHEFSGDFLALVDSGRRRPRDPRSVVK